MLSANHSEGVKKNNSWEYEFISVLLQNNRRRINKNETNKSILKSLNIPARKSKQLGTCNSPSVNNPESRSFFWYTQCKQNRCLVSWGSVNSFLYIFLFNGAIHLKIYRIELSFFHNLANFVE